MPGSNQINNLSSTHSIYAAETAPRPTAVAAAAAAVADDVVDSYGDILYSACAERPPSLAVVVAVTLLDHRGASAEAREKFCNLAAMLTWAKFAARGKSLATVNGDPFAQLLLRPIDWSAVNNYIADLVEGNNPEEVTIGLKTLVQGAGSNAWKQFSLEADISRIRIGQADSWSRDVKEALLRCVTLVGADLGGAPLQLDLKNLNLTNANLIGAQMRGANLKNTNLSGAKFGGASCVVPVLMEYADLHKTSDEFHSLLHPLTEAYAALEKSEIPNWPANEHALDTAPLQVYANFCKWNLLPPMTRRTAEHLINCLNFLHHRPNWLSQYQDLANQLIYRQKDWDVFDFFFEGLRRDMGKDPKIASFVKKHPDRDWKNYFFGITADGHPYAIPSRKYRAIYERLRATPSFDLKQLTTAVTGTSKHEPHFKYREGMLTAMISAEDYL